MAVERQSSPNGPVVEMHFVLVDVMGRLAQTGLLPLMEGQTPFTRTAGINIKKVMVHIKLV